VAQAPRLWVITDSCISRKYYFLCVDGAIVADDQNSPAVLKCAKLQSYKDRSELGDSQLQLGKQKNPYEICECEDTKV
jgi:hypothetical protein